MNLNTILEKNKIDNITESDKEVALILERQKEAREGKIKSLDDSIKDFVVKRNAWKSIL